VTKNICLIASVMLFFGCSKSSVILFEELPKEGWIQQNWVSFSHTHRLPKKEVALNWVLRHDDDYPFANIHLIAEWKTPKGIIASDTLTYLLAHPDGTWLGSGLYIKEHSLPFLDRFLLDEPGNYSFRIRPAVRANDNLVGEKALIGIHQIGLELKPLIK
jgi:gliding motility-associated lipoprotein GldH